MIALTTTFMFLTFLTLVIDKFVSLHTRNTLVLTVRTFKTMNIKLTSVVLIAAFSGVAGRAQAVVEFSSCLAADAGLIILVTFGTDSTSVGFWTTGLIRTVHTVAIHKDSAESAIYALCLFIVTFSAGMTGVVGNTADIVRTGLAATTAVRRETGIATSAGGRVRAHETAIPDLGIGAGVEDGGTAGLRDGSSLSVVFTVDSGRT